MKSRERVLKAMLRKEPDRVPILCHYTPEIQELLEKHTGLEGLDVNCSLGDDAIILWLECVPCLTELSRKEKLMKLNGGFD